LHFIVDELLDAHGSVLGVPCCRAASRKDANPATHIADICSANPSATPRGRPTAGGFSGRILFYRRKGALKVPSTSKTSFSLRLETATMVRGGYGPPAHNSSCTRLATG